MKDQLFLMLSALLLIAFTSPILSNQALEQEGGRILERSQALAQFYELPEGTTLVEITDRVMKSPIASKKGKELFQQFERRLFLFSYPSDGLQVKALISFVPHPEQNPTLFFLRGGNRLFGIPSPDSEEMTYENYTVIAPLYRGGLSEGVDEFGGADVNDVKALVDYLPILEKKLAIHIQQENMFLLGESRGGMQLFLSLARFPELQARFTKVVSLSGMLDLWQTTQEREDMKEMLVEDFGLVPGINEQEWINFRNPIEAAKKISPELPILIIQGTADRRVSLAQGYHMVDTLTENCSTVTYWEFVEGNHVLTNLPDRMKLIATWLAE